MKKAKKYFRIFALLMSFISYSQNKEILVLDSVTKLPIESANLYYSVIQEGTFTNSDGKATIRMRDYDLKISHISYEEKIINDKEFQNSNTFFLTPKSIILDEVIIKRSFNLTKALNYVFENYEKLYEDQPFEKECYFKETLSIDNTLKRLIVTKVNWWSKSYEIKHLRDLKLRLGSIDFNKNNPMNIFTDTPNENNPFNSGFIDTKNLISTIYLNSFLINFMKFNPNLDAVVENYSAHETIVSFTSDWKTAKDYSFRTKGKIIFDKESKAIISFTNEVENENLITKSLTSKSKKEFSYENIKSVSILNFRKNINNKWVLNSFEASGDFSITYNNISHQGNLKNNLYVLKNTAIERVKNVGLINLSKPIYQNLPNDIITNSNSILLSNEENNFIEGK